MYSPNFHQKHYLKRFFYILSFFALIGVIVLLFIYGTPWLKVFAGLAIGVTVLSAIMGLILLKMTSDYYKINSAFWDGITGFLLAPYLYLIGSVVPLSIMVLVRVPAIYIKIIVFTLIISPPIFYARYLLSQHLSEHNMTLGQYLKKKINGKNEDEVKKELKIINRIETLYNKVQKVQERVQKQIAQRLYTVQLYNEELSTVPVSTIDKKEKQKTN